MTGIAPDPHEMPEFVRRHEIRRRQLDDLIARDPDATAVERAATARALVSRAAGVLLGAKPVPPCYRSVHTLVLATLFALDEGLDDLCGPAVVRFSDGRPRPLTLFDPGKDSDDPRPDPDDRDDADPDGWRLDG